MKTSRNGHCQCDRIHIQCANEPPDVSFCYCSLCRKLSGSAFEAYIEVPLTTFEVTRGAEHLTVYDITDRFTKQFCKHCGTMLFSTHTSFPDVVYICPGLLDDTEGLTPKFHQFVGSKAPWYAITDRLTQYEGWFEEYR